MNQETIELLGFPQVVEILQGCAQTPFGRRELAKFSPLASLGQAQSRLDLIAEVSRRRASAGNFGLSQLDDPDPLLQALRGGSPEPADFLGLLEWARAGVAVGSELAGRAWPLLAERWSRVADFRPLAREIERVFDPSGEIRETADPELGAVRRRHKKSRERAQETLRRFFGGSSARWLVQDPFVTQRNNRYVIPVKVEHQKDLPGVVHATSSSGATLFMEPFAVVELNNECLYCQDRELEIVARILSRLTQFLRPHLPAFAELAQALAELDALQACSEFASRHRCVTPDLAEHPPLALEEARHPLLARALGDDKVVPVTIRMDAQRSVLIVSGPNAGGKTLALKTVGLLALMAQAGLPVPAAQARLPFFRQILADIGDHQSIARNLSTFSAHILRIREMMEILEPPALILLDEIGAGTDPDYGAALGIAALDFFHAGGALVVATTHHRAVKQFAATAPQVQNASVALDAATLRPTYRLTFGEAGESSALEIAEQLGLPAPVLERARGLLDDRQIQIERYLAKLREELEALRAQRETLEREAEALRRRDQARELELERRRAEIEKRAESALADWASQFKRESEGLVKAAKDRFEAARLREELKRKQAGLQESFRRKMRREMGKDEPAPEASGTGSDLAPGDLVYDSFFRRRARVLELQGESAVLDVDGKRVTRPLAQLSRIESREVTRRPSRHVTLNVVEDSDPELNLVGAVVEVALDRLDKFLDRAFLSELSEVRIIHGFGKGRLREAVSEFLAGHPQVRRHRVEGGATVATLKD